ncbi:MAG: HTH domain-containing protein [Gammaproteobacteria bacterium]|nr:HTH domain-containing protein [Gammaproteobacteria bacterium]
MAVFMARFNKITVTRMRSFFRTLSEKDQRRYAALEAQRLSHGGISYIAEILGCSTRTIHRGINELRKSRKRRKMKKGKRGQSP